jgi:hypothetical protein
MSRRDLYNHQALACDHCGPNTDGWHVVHQGDRKGTFWPHRKPAEGEPPDGFLVECDRCLAHQRHTLRQWDIFLHRWLSGIVDPRVIRQGGGRTRNAGALLTEAAPSNPKAATALSARVTSSTRGQGTRR